MNKLFYQSLFLLLIINFPLIIYANTINFILPTQPLKWVSAVNLPPGAKLAFLVGNPNKKEFYVVRLKLPANYMVPAHSHINNEYNTVITGTYYLGIGKNINRKDTIALPKGSFILFPARAIHYGFTNEETILEISGIGPWGTIPRKLKLETEVD